MIGAERLLWQGVIFGVVCTLILTALLLGTVGKGSTAAFWLLLPAVWLTNTIIGTVIATSDSGPGNFILMVLASSFLNTFMYGVVFFALSKAVSAGRDG
ncbi:MAG TPA: hypothetical protein VH140_10285 [Candidatus Acidoferrum sp.]|jgi:hypothetical protein|nr:hypothetical protein [Candidatus Acidoferrum sp.]